MFRAVFAILAVLGISDAHAQDLVNCGPYSPSYVCPQTPIISQTVNNGVITYTKMDNSTGTLDTGVSAASAAATAAAAAATTAQSTAAAAQAAATNAPLKQPYQVSSATSGTVAMASGIGVLRFTNSTLLASITVKLPPSPMDQQLARIVSPPLGITGLVVQDANGNAVASSYSVGALASTLWQYEATAWVKLQ